MCYMSCAIFVSNQLNVYIHHEDKINMHYYISHPHIQCYPLQKKLPMAYNNRNGYINMSYIT